MSDSASAELTLQTECFRLELSLDSRRVIGTLAFEPARENNFDDAEREKEELWKAKLEEDEGVRVKDMLKLLRFDSFRLCQNGLPYKPFIHR